MPRCESTAPRNISPPANAWPESFSTTRCQLGCASPSAAAAVTPSRLVLPFCTPRTLPSSLVAAACPPGPGLWLGSAGLADLEPGKRPHAGPVLGQQLLDRLLLIPDVRLLDQHDVLQECVHPALDDLRYGLLGLALVAGHLLGDPALVRHHVGRNLLAGHVPRAH